MDNHWQTSPPTRPNATRRREGLAAARREEIQRPACQSPRSEKSCGPLVKKERRVPRAALLFYVEGARFRDFGLSVAFRSAKGRPFRGAKGDTGEPWGGSPCPPAAERRLPRLRESLVFDAIWRRI